MLPSHGAARGAPVGWTPPDVLAEYRLVRPLGRGSMGQVYLAEDTLLDRPVAVKFIAQRRPDEASRRRFFVEARAVARLSHPNVVAVHRVGEVEGRPYLVTELVRGRSLAELPKPVPFDLALSIGLGIARGLAAAHGKGVLHRDVKPANVMLADGGEVKLLDFGLAKIAGADALKEGASGHVSPDASGEHSVDGDVAGTPLYMAPEALAGEPATRRSDVYAAGAVLYELCAGVAPRETLAPDATAEVWIAAEVGPLRGRAPDVDARLAAVVDRCLSRDPALRFASADELGDALAAVAPEVATTAVPEGNPYRGLTPFGAEHRALFFGRAAEGRAVLDRLRADGLVVVAGDSGVGKSSLCRAGVLPAVAEGALGDGRACVLAALVPGRHPVAALVTALAAGLGLDEAALVRDVREDPAALARAVRAALGGRRGLVVFVDQLEELVTLAGEEDAGCFAEALARLPATAAGVRVLATVRGDFFTRLLGLPGLGEEMSRAFYLLRPMSGEGVRAAITGPAAQKGVRFEPAALVDTLAAAAGAAGGLPLLQFALAELWEARGEGEAITAGALEAIGGVEGALARHADEVLFGLSTEARAAARRVLLRLVTAEGTRARRTAGELGVEEAAVRVAVEAMVRGRLLVAGESEGATAYELAHEALLERWATLRGWLDEGGTRRALADRVETAAAEWERLGRAPEALWTGKRLEEVKGLGRADVSARAAALLDASRAQARRARLRQLGIVLAGPVVLALALGGLRWKSARDVDRLVGKHVTDAATLHVEGKALHEAADEGRKKAYTLFDGATGATVEEVAPKKEEAERVWAEALDRAREAEAKLVKTGQSLEAALALDPGRAVIRGAIGDVTVERLALAEGFHAEERRADLALRVGSYDPDGSRAGALSAQPQVTLDTRPPGAVVSVERYEDRGGKKVPVPGEALETTPLRDRTMAGGAGSYRLTFRAPGRAEVRYPVLLGPGEHFEATVDLPEERAVPAGYAYVPAGRFLLGSTDPEALRKSLENEPPMHESRTGSYLIALRETTFGEWLTFLGDLPAAERAIHTPASRARQWGVELSALADGTWQLTLTLNGVALTAREGEPIRLAERDRRSVLDWRKLPVSAINYNDALAYVGWLDRTGRLPGARLCDEREWERAARGADGRAYPHGDVLDDDDADFDRTYGRKPLAYGPDEVGSHQASVSPFGVLDMTGNVYEMTTSMRARSEVVIRGGSWYYDSISVLVVNRTAVERQTRDIGTGVRVCTSVVSWRAGRHTK